MKYLTQILFLFIFVQLNAQTNKCSFATERIKYFSNKSDYSVFLSDNEKKLSSVAGNIELRDEITIPVVFHVFNRENADFKVKLPDIYEQLDILNKAFSAGNYDIKYVPDTFSGLVGNTGINFCIGKKVVSGKVIKGILFYTTDKKNFADEYLDEDNKRMKIKHNSFGGSDSWDTDKYINVWIGEMAYNNGTSTFPGIDADYRNEEGIVININNLQINSKNKKVIAHEMGHYFNLYHIWGNAPGCENDDEVDDTPLQDNYYTGCPVGDKFSCGSLDMYMNYMDYTDDDCSLMFTKGQAERIRASINIYRKTLIENNSLCDVQVVTDLFEVIKLYQYNNNISLVKGFMTDDNIDVAIFNISGQKVYSGKIDKRETVKNIRHIFFNQGIYLVQLRLGNNYNTKKIIVF